MNDPLAFASAGASLSNLRYRLIDLDLNDGVMPTITFYSPGSEPAVSGNAYGRAVSTINGGPGPSSYVSETMPFASTVTWAGSAEGSSHWLPLQPLRATSLDGVSQVAVEANLLSASTRLKPADARSGAGPTYEFDFNPNTWMSNAISGVSAGGRALDFADLFLPVPDPVSGKPYYVSRAVGDTSIQARHQAPAFVLSANTAVVFESTATASLQLDMGKLSDPQLQVTDVTAYALAEMIVSAAAPMTDQSRWATSADAMASLGGTSDRLSASLYLPPRSRKPAASQQSKDLSLTFSNLRASSVTAYIYGDVSVGVESSGIGTIPEPSTYALMGLGLVGLSLVKRRSRSA